MRLRLATTAIGLILLVASPADAKTFVVTKRGDLAPDACRSGDCSLREAVRAAHERAGADVIELPNAPQALQPQAWGNRRAWIGHGRGWFRTTDLSRVKRALSH
jgi:CSLREA domain-containing protein